MKLRRLFATLYAAILRAGTPASAEPPKTNDARRTLRLRDYVRDMEAAGYVCSFCQPIPVPELMTDREGTIRISGESYANHLDLYQEVMVPAEDVAIHIVMGLHFWYFDSVSADAPNIGDYF